MGKKAMIRWSAARWPTQKWRITPSLGARGNLFPRTWPLWRIPRPASRSETWSGSIIVSACTALPTRRASQCCRRNLPWKWGQVWALSYFLLGVGASVDLKATSVFSLVHLKVVSQAAGSSGHPHSLTSPSFQTMSVACEFFISQSQPHGTSPWLPPSGAVCRRLSFWLDWGQWLNLLTLGHPGIS